MGVHLPSDRTRWRSSGVRGELATTQMENTFEFLLKFMFFDAPVSLVSTLVSHSVVDSSEFWTSVSSKLASLLKEKHPKKVKNILSMVP